MKRKISARLPVLLLLTLLLSSCVTARPENAGQAAQTEEPDLEETAGGIPERDRSTEKGADRSGGEHKKGDVIANHQTEIKDFEKNRMKNLGLAAKKINGRVIKAGEEFSFNRSVGPRTMSRGFRRAVIFKNDEKVKEIGGGICQISTTLYQAALEAGFEIIERHGHGLEVPYARKGDDATVYYGRLDLRFVNTSGVDVALECGIGEENVFVSITAV